MNTDGEGMNTELEGMSGLNGLKKLNELNGQRSWDSMPVAGREQRGGSGLLRNEWLVRQVMVRKTAWGNYGFCCSPNDKIANSVPKSNYRCAFVPKEEVPRAAVGVVVR